MISSFVSIRKGTGGGSTLCPLSAAEIQSVPGLISHSLISLEAAGAQALLSCHLYVHVVQTVLPPAACSPFIFSVQSMAHSDRLFNQSPRANAPQPRETGGLWGCLQKSLPVITPAALTALFLPGPDIPAWQINAGTAKRRSAPAVVDRRGRNPAADTLKQFNLDSTPQGPATQVSPATVSYHNALSDRKINFPPPQVSAPLLHQL